MSKCFQAKTLNPSALRSISLLWVMYREYKEGRHVLRDDPGGGWLWQGWCLLLLKYWGRVKLEQPGFVVFIGLLVVGLDCGYIDSRCEKEATPWVRRDGSLGRKATDEGRCPRGRGMCAKELERLCGLTAAGMSWLEKNPFQTDHRLNRTDRSAVRDPWRADTLL